MSAPQPMPLGKYLARFALMYAVLLVVVAVLSTVWPSMGNYASVPAIMAAAMGTSVQFASDNKRAFSDAERRTMTRISFLITWALSLVSTALLVLAQVGVSQVGEIFSQLRMALETPPNGMVAAGAFIFISLLLYGVLNFCYGRMARTFAEAQAKR